MNTEQKDKIQSIVIVASEFNDKQDCDVIYEAINSLKCAPSQQEATKNIKQLIGLTHNHGDSITSSFLNLLLKDFLAMDSGAQIS